ncbi:MAG: PqqD family peptide modification chaperone [Betaproteobacteria bacterium]|nr:PqqD family peptide modification chaperone [Betaproteobacteria bacterium]
MSNELHSPSWYRVAGLRPRLKSHAEVHRHHYRGQLWYVLQDRASRRMYRFNPAAWQVIGLLDGHRTVQDAWDLACHRLGDDAPTQDETIRLLGQLHGADLLQSEIAPDVDELLRRYSKQQSGKWWRNVRNPMSVKLPLIDPDRFLKRTLPFYRWLFSVWGFLLWLAVVGGGAAAAGLHWSDLTNNLADRILAPGNLVGMLVIFPFVKIFHEFGHACSVRARGGEVHEMGVMFLVFLPIPYVDASASSAFRSKWDRFQVGGAGMMAELALAAAAMFVWLSVEPGLVRAICFNVMLIAGISTVLFNGNPLLRYDGYYMLTDLVEIPNLGPRGGRYLGYLVQRYGFGLRELQPPEATPGERWWLVLYTIVSYVYRLFITFAIVTFVATQYFVVGVILAVWAAISAVLFPIGKGIAFVARGRNLRRQRNRAWAVTGGAVGVLVAAFFLIPFPIWTRTQGVLWVPEHAVVRSESEGFVTKLDTAPGAFVERGVALVSLEDPLLEPQERILVAKLDELDFKLRDMEVQDRVQGQIVRDEIAYTKKELARVRERLKGLVVESPAAGRFVVPNPSDLPARFVHKGEQIGFVAPRDQRLVRVVVGQDDVDLVRRRTESIEVRLAEKMDDTVSAVVLREVPAATGELPSLALSDRGGGNIALDPRKTDRPVALKPVFHFELAIPASDDELHIGERVYVRFDHGSEPLAYQTWRALRRLFLRRFTV